MKTNRFLDAALGVTDLCHGCDRFNKNCADDDSLKRWKRDYERMLRECGSFVPLKRKEGE